MTDPITLVTAGGAAELAGVTTKTIYKWVKTGRLAPRWQAVSHSGPHPQYLFDRAEVIAAGKLVDPAAQELARRQPLRDGHHEDVSFPKTAAEIERSWYTISGQTDPARVLHWLAGMAEQFRADNTEMFRAWVHRNYRPVTLVNDAKESFA